MYIGTPDRESPIQSVQFALEMKTCFSGQRDVNRKLTGKKEKESFKLQKIKNTASLIFASLESTYHLIFQCLLYRLFWYQEIDNFMFSLSSNDDVINSINFVS